MRHLFVTLCLSAALPLCAYDGSGSWFLDVHSTTGTLTGHYVGLQNSQPFDVDLQSDLGITADKAKIGGGFEYQGHRFGLELASNEVDFAGSRVVDKAVTINGQTFNVGALVNSTVKAKTTTFNWTIRALSFDHFWIGFDLGVRGMTMDLAASGVNGFTGVTATAAYTLNAPVPQIGLATGIRLWNNRIIGRAFYHTLAYHGASFNVAGADLRFFPISWLGIMAFTNTAKLNVPQDSISNSANIVLNQGASGLGLVARF